METQKIVNLLNGSENDSLQLKNGILLIVNLMVIIHKMMK